MSAITASILAGPAHSDDRGFIPTHQLFLSEDGRPRWSLFELNSGNLPIVRIPTKEHVLEDALLMVGLFVFKDPKIVEAANAVRKEFAGRVQQYDDIDEVNRAKLFALTREVGPQSKVVITVLKGSCIASHLHVLDAYRMSIELCLSVNLRNGDSKFA